MTNLEWIRLELGGLYGGEAVRELDELNRLYRLYDGEVRSAWSMKVRMPPTSSPT
jgi:hypothetical protein